MGQWKSDLAFGKHWEGIAISTIGEGVVSVPEGNFKPYDFEANNLKYEVKADRLAHKYGCRTMFIEYECNGRPSGITSTEADFWCYFMVKPVGFDFYVIPVSVLRAEIPNALRMVSGGDGMRSKGYIMSVSKFELYKRNA
jgi:hypothetical protein